MKARYYILLLAALIIISINVKAECLNCGGGAQPECGTGDCNYDCNKPLNVTLLEYCEVDNNPADCDQGIDCQGVIANTTFEFSPLMEAGSCYAACQSIWNYTYHWTNQFDEPEEQDYYVMIGQYGCDDSWGTGFPDPYGFIKDTFDDTVYFFDDLMSFQSKWESENGAECEGSTLCFDGGHDPGNEFINAECTVFEFGDTFDECGAYDHVWFQVEASSTSMCVPICFDGAVEGGEECDIGGERIFHIRTPQDLQNMEINDNIVYIQMNDIDMTGFPFVCIGTTSTGFQGTYIGNGFEIQNLENVPQGNGDEEGLFCVIENGRVIGMTLVNPDITGNSRVGGIVGQMKGGLIVNSSVIGGIVEGDRDSVGGLVGDLLDTSEQGAIISNSFSTASIIATVDSFDNERIGGLVGGILASHDKTITIQNSYAQGSILAKEGPVGGLIGYAKSDTIDESIIIIDSYFIGTVNDISDNNQGRAGGLIGQTINDGTFSITNSFASASVTGSQDVGGFIGENDGGVSIIKSYWNSDLEPFGVGCDDGSCSGAEGRTTDDLTSPYGGFETFLTWDFETIWYETAGLMPNLYGGFGSVDISDIGYNTCEGIGFDGGDKVVPCIDCFWQFEVCTEDPTTCGDGEVQDPNDDGFSEECDGSEYLINGFLEIDPVSCNLFDSNYIWGDLGCNVDCTIDIDQCVAPTCGDGSICFTDFECDPWEICENIVPASGQGSCATILTEECDDGNSIFDDQCDVFADNALGNGACTLTFCGDAVTQVPNGEGLGGVANNGMETCDDGNNDFTDLCDTFGDNPLGLPGIGCFPTFCSDDVVQRPNGLFDQGPLDDGFEDCDGNEYWINGARQTGPVQCSDYDPSYVGGILGCFGSCAIDESACILPQCGDGTTDPGEECDDGIVDPDDTYYDPFFEDDDGFCVIDVDLPQNSCELNICGDGYLVFPEECDDDDGDGTDECDTDGVNALGNGVCSLTICGDQVVQTPNGEVVGGILGDGMEQCDDGNDDPRDACDTMETAPFAWDMCTNTICGDGLVQLPNGDTGLMEECDIDEYFVNGDYYNGTVACSVLDPMYTGGNLGCGSCVIDTGACTAPIPSCGDGVVDPGEECDDYFDDPLNDTYFDVNPFDDDGVCVIDNFNPLQSCLYNICGDGYLNASTEECDDDDGDGTDECDTDGINLLGNGFCSITFCGDNVTQLPNGVGLGGIFNDGNESCDDGDDDPRDACDTTGSAPLSWGMCTDTLCGDQLVQLPNARGLFEECDIDEYFINGTYYNGTVACSVYDPLYTGGDLACASCLIDLGACTSPGPICGNKIIEPPEECDGGPMCSDTCTIIPANQSLIVDFNGINEISEPEWIKIYNDSYVLGGNGWDNFSIINDLIKFIEDPELGAAEGFGKLIHDYQKFNSTVTITLPTNATYNITYVVGSFIEDMDSYTINVFDETASLGSKLIPAIPAGESQFIYHGEQFRMHGVANFTFTKVGISDETFISGIIFECVHSLEIVDGLDNDCNGIVDDANASESYMQNNLNQTVFVRLVLGLEKNNGGWENYTVIYDSDTELGFYIPFNESGNVNTDYPGNNTYYNSSYHLLQYYWNDVGGWISDSNGSFRAYAELYSPNGSIILIKQPQFILPAQRIYSQTFTVS